MDSVLSADGWRPVRHHQDGCNGVEFQAVSVADPNFAANAIRAGLVDEYHLLVVAGNPVAPDADDGGRFLANREDY